MRTKKGCLFETAFLNYAIAYQSAQTIEALSHVGGRVVKIVPESGAE